MIGFYTNELKNQVVIQDSKQLFYIDTSSSNAGDLKLKVIDKDYRLESFSSVVVTD
jgi:hypothetical protein